MFSGTNRTDVSGSLVNHKSHGRHLIPETTGQNFENAIQFRVFLLKMFARQRFNRTP